MANQGNKSVVQANAKVSAPAPAPAGTKKTKTKTPTPASKRTDAATKKEDKPSKLAADVAKRAKETKLDTGNLDLDISDKLKATDKVVDQNIKDAAAKLKPGELKKTGGFLGFGGKYTYKPGDVSAFNDSTKDFTKKVTDTAAQIKAEREKKAAAPVPAPKDAKQPWETTGSEPAPTDGGKDVLDQLDKDTTATGGGTPAAPGDEGGTAAPSTGGKGIKINYKIGSSAGADIGKEAFVKKQKAGDIKSTQVVFNLKDAKTGQKTRSIKPGDPEYADFMARYKKIPGAVLEALIRAGAILTEEGWYLNGQLIEDVQLDYTPPEFETQYYYDAYGNLRMMSEEDFAELSLAEAVVEMQVQMELEEELIGKQHKIDANKNNKIDAEDFELLKKKKTMKEESSEEETEVEQIDEVTMKEKQKLQKPTTVPKPTMPSPKMLPKRPIQPTTVPMPDRMKGIPSDLDDYRKNKQLRASTIDPKKLADQQMSTQDAIALGAAGAEAMNRPLKSNSGEKNLASNIKNKLAGAAKAGLAGFPGSGFNEEVEQNAPAQRTNWPWRIDESTKIAGKIARSIASGDDGLTVSRMNADESGADDMGHKGKTVFFVHAKDDEGEGDNIAISAYKGKYTVSHTLSGSAGEEKPTKHFDSMEDAVAHGRRILGTLKESNEYLDSSTKVAQRTNWPWRK